MPLLTKTDGTSKGGIVIAIKDLLNIVINIMRTMKITKRKKVIPSPLWAAVD